MPKKYTISQGETIPSISFQFGFFPETIWNNPANQELKTKRQIPDVLMPGDVVSIPDLRRKDVSAASDRRHRFRRRGVPAKTRFQLFDHEMPLKNVAYSLVVGSQTRRGVTDEHGVLEQFIPPDAETGELRIEPNGPVFPLTFGRMDPISEVTGVQKRLNNLGFTCGEPDGELNEATKLALQEFQKRMKLAVTGELDDETRNQIAKIHDEKSAFPDFDVQEAVNQ